MGFNKNTYKIILLTCIDNMARLNQILYKLLTNKRIDKLLILQFLRTNNYKSFSIKCKIKMWITPDVYFAPNLRIYSRLFIILYKAKESIKIPQNRIFKDFCQ